jgi:hypothetical protein
VAMKRIEVFCRTQTVGFHHWPNAPEQVDYLRSNHRHVFHITVAVSVKHTDRDVEFITLRKDVDNYFQSRSKQFGPESCEMIADRVQTYLEKKDYRVTRVTVSEDNENGATVYYE